MLPSGHAVKGGEDTLTECAAVSGLPQSHKAFEMCLESAVSSSEAKEGCLLCTAKVVDGVPGKLAASSLGYEGCCPTLFVQLTINGQKYVYLSVIRSMFIFL